MTEPSTRGGRRVGAEPVRDAECHATRAAREVTVLAPEHPPHGPAPCGARSARTSEVGLRKACCLPVRGDAYWLAAASPLLLSRRYTPARPAPPHVTTVTTTIGAVPAPSTEPADAPRQDGAAPVARYGPGTRTAIAVIAGVVAGALMISSAGVGAGYAVNEVGSRIWTPMVWGDHWAWRAVWSVVTSFTAGFIAGMIARQRPGRVGALVGAVSVLVWGAMALAGWTGHLPNSPAPLELPLGYRIVATLLTLVTVPASMAGATAGVPFGAVNGPHFDARRGTLLGVRWYHFVWLPVLLHVYAAEATYAAMYSFGWLVNVWKAGMSFFSFVPFLFLAASYWTLTLMGTGLFKAYEALAGFDQGDSAGAAQPAVWRRVLKFGIGYPALAVIAQTAINLVHFGLARLVGR